jgi:hypothetical protein
MPGSSGEYTTSVQSKISPGDEDYGLKARISETLEKEEGRG